MDVWQSTDGIFLGQGKYAVEILKRFAMMDCKAMATPMSSNLKLLSVASLETVDAMMYRQMIGSLRYLKGTVDYGIKYDTNQKIDLEGYVDSDWASSSIDRKSTSWCGRKQSCVALSTAEAKDVATCSLEVVCFF